MTAPMDGGSATSPFVAAVDGGGAVDDTQAWTLNIMPVIDRALSDQRLSGGDIDADRLAERARTAVDLIDKDLDRPAPFTVAELPSPVRDAAITVTIELYRRKDAPFGITNSYGPDGGAIRLSRDVLAGVESQLAPYRGGWGFA